MYSCNNLTEKKEYILSYIYKYYLMFYSHRINLKIQVNLNLKSKVRLNPHMRIMFRFFTTRSRLFSRGRDGRFGMLLLHRFLIFGKF